MTIRNLLLATLSIVFFIPSLQAQELSWRKHRKLAQGLEAEGDYFSAAENYRMAWEKKQKKQDLIYKAAENYYRLRDYRAAADAYQHVDLPYGDDALLALKFGRALKQDNQYDRAKTVLEGLMDSYTGQDRAILQEIIQTELRGIDFARTATGSMNRSMEISHPGTMVNTDDEEFGARMTNDGTLWFSSTQGGQARIYTSQRVGRNWSKAADPANFPVVQGGQYASGAFSPDELRFYFTICNNDQGWQGANTRCEIYMTRKQGNSWSTPERLPDFINGKGVNTTHPAVAHANGQEYLFFASNREGGRGNLDIWYVTRDLGIDNLDFTFPINLGPSVNTLGDEITPFYDAEEETLYFASNGHPTMGGLDIFKSSGAEVNWSAPQNLGLPINSGADDYDYAVSAAGFGGFFASNRAFGGEKTNTRHEDVFEFSVGGRQITLKSNIYDQDSGELLRDVKVSLYQLFEDGTENELINKVFPSGSYLYELLPNRRFRVEVQKDGYEAGGYVFATDDPNTYTYGQPLYLTGSGEGGIMTDNTEIPIEDRGPDGNGVISIENTGETTTRPSGSFPVNDSALVEYTTSGIGPRDNLEYTSTAPRFDGTYFRVQVAALSRYAPDSPKFANLPNYGTIRTETVNSRGLTRVLVGEYFTQSDATFALSEIRGMYPDAFIVQYNDGARYGRVNF